MWKDRWLSIPESFKVVSPKTEDSNVDYVEQLMDLEEGSCNIEKVRNTFLHHEAETILGILISPGMNGVFSVKSAYGVALKILKESKKGGDESEGLDRTKRM